MLALHLKRMAREPSGESDKIFDTSYRPLDAADRREGDHGAAERGKKKQKLTIMISCSRVTSRVVLQSVSPSFKNVCKHREGREIINYISEEIE